MTVVDDVSDEDREIALERRAAAGLEAELGEELGFQIFWHPEDAKKAAEQDREFGDILRVKQARAAFGRIAAQTAKQVLIQRVRDEERDLIFNEFKDRKGELIKGVVRRFEKGNNLIVDLGRTEGILPFREQTPARDVPPGRPHRRLREGDRPRGARPAGHPVARATRSSSRSSSRPRCPEIYEGIVRVVACAREPGARSKIAVTSRDADVDPVGACVGMKGSRVQAVVQELRGEKIDIVPYDRDPARFVCAAIQPAEVNKVIVDEADGRMELVVPDEKLSLAIGRKGQNVRLAAQLTGWKLDIISESKFKQMEEEAIAALQQIEGVTDAIARSMYRLGFRALEELAEATRTGARRPSPGSAGPEAAQKIKENAEVDDGAAPPGAHPGGRGTNSRRSPSVTGSSSSAGSATARSSSSSEAGYRTVEDIHREDEDKLAIKTGLGIKKARAIKQGAELFLGTEAKPLEAQRRLAAKAAKERESEEHLAEEGAAST